MRVNPGEVHSWQKYAVVGPVFVLALVWALNDQYMAASVAALYAVVDLLVIVLVSRVRQPGDRVF